ncbi:alpha/beta fold hydrolase [Salinibacter sp.]|nr:alpha/beta hydrolase [Salinibacter sp.]
MAHISGSVSLETLHLPGPDPPIAFVHGGLGSLWNPYPQLYQLREEQALLTYALAGNGRSSRRPEQSIEGHVGDLRALIEHYDLGRPIVHGHSYGTAIAIEYAKKHPCRGLVLHGGGDHDLTPAWEKPLMRTFMALRLYRVFPRNVLMRALARWAACHEETSGALIDDFLRSNPMARRRSAWETVTKAFWGYDGRRDIGRVEAPALVIHGPADRIVPMEVARETARRLPNGAFHSIERAGHAATAERPAEYNRLLRLFVEVARGKQSLATVFNTSR